MEKAKRGVTIATAATRVTVQASPEPGVLCALRSVSSGIKPEFPLFSRTTRLVPCVVLSFEVGRELKPTRRGDACEGTAWLAYYGAL